MNPMTANKVQLDGVEVYASGLTQHARRAAYCDFLLPVTTANQKAALREFARVGPLDKYRGLHVSGIADLSFLAEFPDLLYLEIVDQPKVKLQPLAGLPNLRGLRIETPGTGIDFSWFPLLEVFVGDWHADNVQMQRCRELRELRVWGLRPKSADLTVLAGMVRLEQLEITKTNLTSLAGIETLEDLRICKIAYAPELTSMAALGGGELQLRELDLSHAKKIQSYEPIAACRWLRNLKLSSCTPLADLHWLAPLQRLEFLSFVDTNVVSGDLTALLDLPELRYAGSMDKRHYDPRIDVLNEQLARRHA
jgi:hypothetical protein